VKVSGGRVTVDLKNLGYRDEPFVLAKDVNQVFYVKDMSTKPKKRKTNDNDSDNEPKRHIVLSGKRNIMGIEDKSDILEDYEKNDGIPPFIVNSDSSILLNNEDTPWLLRDITKGHMLRRSSLLFPLDMVMY
jgi:hypothetical protein